ncbi:hypothetical protein AB0K51_32385 [Kitasatospora sp. NPDC049285]|uniref:hypothetical protein n=1 Tax=Kitasatospora sp. NPDC049285 TaxID=3157096 RepID=UPI00342FF64C
MLVLVGLLLSGGATAWAMLAEQETVAEQSYFESISRLDIDSGPARVTIRAGGSDRIVVEERVGWALGRPAVRKEVKDGALAVTVGCPRGHQVLGCAVALDIEVPAATVVHARNGSGRTEVHGISGETSVETGSGQVELIAVSGPIWAKGGSGQILGSKLSAPTTRVFSSSAEVVLRYDRAPQSVTARLSSGGLTLTVPDDHNHYRVDLSTASGHQDVDPSIQDSSAPRSLDVTAASGSVTLSRGGPQ